MCLQTLSKDPFKLETSPSKMLQKIIQPTIGIFTSIGDAHNEGFVDVAQKIDEKSNYHFVKKLVVFEWFVLLLYLDLFMFYDFLNYFFTC